MPEEGRRRLAAGDAAAGLLDAVRRSLVAAPLFFFVFRARRALNLHHLLRVCRLVRRLDPIGVAGYRVLGRRGRGLRGVVGRRVRREGDDARQECNQREDTHFRHDRALMPQRRRAARGWGRVTAFDELPWPQDGALFQKRVLKLLNACMHGFIT